MRPLESQETPWACSRRRAAMEESSSPGPLGVTGSEITRRELLEAAVVTSGVLIGGQLMPGAISLAQAQSVDPVPAPLDVALRVNGTEHRLTLDPRTKIGRAHV